MTETDKAREVERLLHANKLEEYDDITGRLTIDAHETLGDLEDFMAQALATARADGLAYADAIRALDPSKSEG